MKVESTSGLDDDDEPMIPVAGDVMKSGGDGLVGDVMWQLVWRKRSAADGGVFACRCILLSRPCVTARRLVPAALSRFRRFVHRSISVCMFTRPLIPVFRRHAAT